MENKKLLLIVGSTGKGKSSSIRNMPMDRTAYIDFDRKAIKAFKGMEKLNQWIKVDYVDHLEPGLKALEEDDSIDFIVIDTMSFALDMFVSQKIEGSVDSRAMWGEYKQWFNRIMHIAKTSKKSYVFIMHDKSAYNEEAMEVKTQAYAQGSIFGAVESHFAVVAYAHKYLDENNMPKYGFLVGPTKDTLHLSAKSPMMMFDEPLIKDNDVMLLFEAIDNY